MHRGTSNKPVGIRWGSRISPAPARAVFPAVRPPSTPRALAKGLATPKRLATPWRIRTASLTKPRSASRNRTGVTFSLPGTGRCPLRRGQCARSRLERAVTGTPRLMIARPTDSASPPRIACMDGSMAGPPEARVGRTGKGRRPRLAPCTASPATGLPSGHGVGMFGSGRPGPRGGSPGCHWVRRMDGCPTGT